MPKIRVLVVEDDDDTRRLIEQELGEALLRLVTDAHLEGFYHRPRIDKDLLAERSEGLIGLSGCLASEIARHLVAGQDRKAIEAAAQYRDIFGPGNFSIELQDHGLPQQRQILAKQAEEVGTARSGTGQRRDGVAHSRSPG